MIKRVAVIMGSLFIFSHVQLEFGSWLAKLWPHTRNVFIHPFIDKSYIFPVKEGFRLTWWVTTVCNDVVLIITYFVMAFSLGYFSRKLSSIAWVFFGYHIFDHLMLWYNYKSSYWLYMAELACNIICVLILIFMKEGQGKLKSIS